MKTISIIIPTLNEAELILDTLKPLQTLRQNGHEIILVDGGSKDNTVAIAEHYVDHLLHCASGRALQMNKGAELARGHILLFLHADTQLPDRADRIIKDGLQKTAPLNGSWGRFDVQLKGSHHLLKIIALLMNLRSRLTGIATGDQAIFVERELFNAVGAYPNIQLMEDIALCRMLRKHSKPLCLANKVTSSGRRWEKQGVLRTILTMWCLRLAYFAGADPNKLVKHYP